VVAVILFALGILIWYYWQRDVKQLSYGIVAQGPLVSIRDNVEGRLKVSYAGKPVQNLNLTILRVMNTGNQSVKPEDFKRPLSFTFAAPLLSAEAGAANPPDMGASVRYGGRTATLNPLLINSGESVDIKVLVDGTPGKPGLTYRIVDVSLVAESDLTTSGLTFWQWAVLCITSGAVSVVLSELKSRYDKRITSHARKQALQPFVDSLGRYKQYQSGAKILSEQRSAIINDEGISWDEKEKRLDELSVKDQELWNKYKP